MWQTRMTGRARITDGLGRRSLINRSAATAGGLALATGGIAGSRAATAAPASTPASTPAGAFRLFDDPAMDFGVSFALGEAAYGAGEAGEILATVDAINRAGASYQAFCDHFIAMGNRVSAIARNALSAGNQISARSAFLRSAQYYDQALFFILGTRRPDHEAALYRQMDQQWRAVARLFKPAFEPVHIPYRGTTMPGYFLSGGEGRRPTVIITNGSDAQNIDVYAFGGAAAIERGWHALIYEGPGQGAMLFERKIPFLPDWEKVITPIVDFLYDRADVDRSRIALTGWSFGGALVTRAAAFEHRLAAVCADPGYVSDWDAFPASLRDLFRKGASRQEVNGIWQHAIVPHLTARNRFTLAKRSEIFGGQYLEAARQGRVFDDLWDFAHTVMRYQVADVAARVKIPMLVTQYEHDQFFPGQGRKLYDLLTGPKTLVTFTAAEGASLHDAPLAPQRRNQVVFDWLATTMKSPGGQGPGFRGDRHPAIPRAGSPPSPRQDR